MRDRDEVEGLEVDGMEMGGAGYGDGDEILIGCVCVGRRASSTADTYVRKHASMYACM